MLKAAYIHEYYVDFHCMHATFDGAVFDLRKKLKS